MLIILFKSIFGIGIDNKIIIRNIASHNNRQMKKITEFKNIALS